MSDNKEQIDSINIHENEWLLSRKKFIQTLFLSGIAIQLPWLSACSTDEEIIENCSPLTVNQFKTILSIQDILFPEDGNGPSSKQINAMSYLVWVLNDMRLDTEENNYIIEKTEELESFTKENYGDYFHNLSLGNQEEIIAFISKESWGNKFLSRLLTLILEALLLDPAYGSNTNEIGWNWLNHNAGQPRPTSKILYPEIFKNI